MNFDANAILLSMLVSSIGFVAAVYGKRQGRAPQLVAGIILVVYPYFVTNLLLMGGIAVLVLGLMTLAIKLGY